MANHRNPSNPLPVIPESDRDVYPIVSIDTGSMASLSDAVAMGITTIEALAEYLCVELIDGCLVPDYAPLVVSDGNAESCFDPDEFDPSEAAQEYLNSGDWGGDSPRLQTEFVELVSYRVGIRYDGRIDHVDSKTHLMTLDAEEPDCLPGEDHHWDSPLSIVGGISSNPGVFGKGGGTVSCSVCLRCGCRRTVDTWADGPGGVQGLETEGYQPGYYADEVRAMQIEEAVADLEAEEGTFADQYFYGHGPLRRSANADQMAAYGMALLCGEDAELPGEEAPEEEEAE